MQQRTLNDHYKAILDYFSLVKGNLLFQFGGLFQRNVDFFSRTDNGTTISNQIVYQIASQSIGFTGFNPTGVTSTTSQATYANLASAMLGLVGFTQVLYPREGASLSLLPLGTRSQVTRTIKTYDTSFSDSW